MSLRPVFRLASSPRCSARSIRSFSSVTPLRWSHEPWLRAPQSPLIRRPSHRSSQQGSRRHESTSSNDQEAEKVEKWKIPQLRKAGEEDPRNVPAPEANDKGEVPAYELTFTCKPCSTRSTHRISKHGYHNGTVLITCPNCKNRHVISDHLKIFNDSKKSFEQILKEKQEQLKVGVLDPDGDFEMWDDGTQTPRESKT